MTKHLVFGNQAVVLGALEAGVEFAFSYPGTPASEIGDTFSKMAKSIPNLYFEYSSNEKVALEGAAGAAFSGKKAIVSMKHYGLNVSLDALLPLVYLECPLVVVASDDPGCSSSVQTEQDSRWLSYLGKIPTFEPSSPKQAKEMTKAAFDLAFKHKIPVFIRLTTRVCYSQEVVESDYQKKIKLRRKPPFKFSLKNPNGFAIGSKQTIKLHQKLLGKIEKLKKQSNASCFNELFPGKNKLGIIVSGIGYIYLKEVLREFKRLNPWILKIGQSYPLPEEKIKRLLAKVDRVLVIEQIDPIIEARVKQIISERNLRVKVYGKDVLPQIGQLKPEHIYLALLEITKAKDVLGLKKQLKDNLKVVPRTPYFCPGCPHRPVFYALKEIFGRKKIYGGDIGCYLLGALPPFLMEDFVICMGASIGVSHGISKAGNRKTIALIGDSTFFHAGMPSLANLVFNQSNILVIVLDNYYTAMTGHQPNPGTGENALRKSKEIAIEDVARALKVDWVKTVSPYNLKELFQGIKQGYKVKGVSVLVVKGECRLATFKRARKLGVELPKFKIIKQGKKLKKLDKLHCPAIEKKKTGYEINPGLCSGCGVCQQIVPGYIVLSNLEKNNGKAKEK